MSAAIWNLRGDFGILRAMDINHKHVAEVYRALGNPVRIAIISALAKKELSRDELFDVIGVPGPNFAQHLARLRKANMIRLSRRGRNVSYRLADPKVLMLRDAAEAVYKRSSKG